MSNPAEPANEDLSRILIAGDAAALLDIAHRYGQGLYDFADRIVQDSAASFAVLESALRRARAEAASRPSQLSIRAWLFGLVRDEALAGQRSRTRVDLLADESAEPDATTDRFANTAYSGDSYLAVWAWDAARSLRPRDYSLLDLSLRRHFTPPEIAEIASLSRSTIYATLGRLQSALEDFFASSALYFAGGDTCGDLKSLLGDEAELQPALRREVTRHAESCQTCRNTLGGLPLAADIFAAFLDVDTPIDLADRVAALALPEEVTSPAKATSDQPGLPLGGAAIVATRDDDSDEAEAAQEQVAPGPAAAAAVLDSDAIPPSADAEPSSAPLQAATRPARRVPLAAGRRALEEASEAPERIRFGAGGAARPPGQAGSFAGWFSDGDKMRSIWVFALLAGLTLVAAYVGYAFGDSIRGGGNKPDALPVVTTAGGRARSVQCGSGPINVDQGGRVTVGFESASLTGYAISNTSVRAVSATAAPQFLVAKPQQALKVDVDALPAPGPGARTDEYRLDVTLNKGADRIASECTVLVRVPAAAPAVGTPAPGSATPVGTASPGVTGTPAATGTPPPATATPSGAASPTATRVP